MFMEVKHNYALKLETLFRKKFNCERWGVGGLVNTDRFEHRPVLISTMLVCKLIVGVDIDRPKYHELESFLLKYAPFMDKSMHEMDGDFIQCLIDEIKNLVD